MRRRRAPKRHILPDPKYKSKLAGKFINSLMLDGKKSTAERIFYDALDIVGKKTSESPMSVFEKSVKNVMPTLEVRSRRVGGATYQVPVEVRDVRRQALAIRWLVSYSRDRNERTMAERLANEFIAAYKNEGGAIKKK
jgi:small subunit ribosomal protein S7